MGSNDHILVPDPKPKALCGMSIEEVRRTYQRIRDQHGDSSEEAAVVRCELLRRTIRFECLVFRPRREEGDGWDVRVDCALRVLGLETAKGDEKYEG